MTIQLKAKKIYGKKIRTNNRHVEEIIALWSDVPSMKLEGDVYAVYSNYESNFKGDYDLLVGNEQADFFDSVQIKAGQYVEIPLTIANVEGVGAAWQMIWQDKELEQRRTYQSDIEHYKQDGTISIYLSV